MIRSEFYRYSRLVKVQEFEHLSHFFDCQSTKCSTLSLLSVVRFTLSLLSCFATTLQIDAKTWPNWAEIPRSLVVWCWGFIRHPLLALARLRYPTALTKSRFPVLMLFIFQFVAGEFYSTDLRFLSSVGAWFLHGQYIRFIIGNTCLEVIDAVH